MEVSGSAGLGLALMKPFNSVDDVERKSPALGRASVSGHACVTDGHPL